MSERKSALAVLIVILAIIFMFGSFRTIKAGQVGVKTRFGKVIGTQLNEGLNLKLPFIEKITKISVKVNKYEITGSGASKDLQKYKNRKSQLFFYLLVNFFNFFSYSH